MSLEKVRQVRSGRFFRPADLIIFGIIAAAAIALFILFFAIKKDGGLEGVRIFVRDEVVFEYSFESDEYKVFSSCAEVVNGEKLTVNITTEEGGNLVEIDRAARSVRVVSADCRSRDCVYSPPLTGADGFICCMPHHMRILPFGYKDDGKTVII